MSNDSNNPYQQPNQQPNYQQPNYQQPNYQQPNYQQPNYQQPYQQDYQQPNYQQPNYQQPSNPYQQQGYVKTQYPQYGNAPTTKTQTLSLDFNVAGMFCYMPFFAISLIASIIFLVTEPKNNIFVRFHAIQSLLLSASGTILGILLGIAWPIVIILTAALARGGGEALIPIVVFGMLGLFFLLMITFFVLHFVGMYKAYRNEMWEMPIIGKYARRFAQK